MTTRIKETERNEQLNLETEIYKPLTNTFERIKTEIRKDDNINIENISMIENAIKSIKSSRRRWAKGTGLEYRGSADEWNGVYSISNLDFTPSIVILYKHKNKKVEWRNYTSGEFNFFWKFDNDSVFHVYSPDSEGDSAERFINGNYGAKSGGTKPGALWYGAWDDEPEGAVSERCKRIINRFKDNNEYEIYDYEGGEITWLAIE